MVRVICIVNQKGGVGKTTTAVNLAVGLARSGAQTLLVDLDPQCNATSGLGIRAIAEHPILGSIPLRTGVIATSIRNLAILPGSHRIREIDSQAELASPVFALLRTRLLAVSTGYDFVLYDCPPSAGGLSRLALATATEVLIPIECEYYAMEGLTQLIALIREVVGTLESPTLESSEILLTKYDLSVDLTREVEEEIASHFGPILSDTIIPRDVALAEAPSHGLSVLDYAPRSRGARAYVELCMEVLDRE